MGGGLGGVVDESILKHGSGFEEGSVDLARLRSVEFVIFR
jgi:hypothetical protein